MDLFDRQVIPLTLSNDRASEIIFWPKWLDPTAADKLPG